MINESIQTLSVIRSTESTSSPPNVVTVCSHKIIVKITSFMIILELHAHFQDSVVAQSTIY